MWDEIKMVYDNFLSSHVQIMRANLDACYSWKKIFDFQN